MKDYIHIFGRYYAIEDLKDKFILQLHCGLFAIAMLSFIIAMVFILDNDLTSSFPFLCGLILASGINYLLTKLFK